MLLALAFIVLGISAAFMISNRSEAEASGRFESGSESEIFLTAIPIDASTENFAEYEMIYSDIVFCDLHHND